MEISKDVIEAEKEVAPEDDTDSHLYNPIAAAFAKQKASTSGSVQQKIFGKTIVFVQTKKDADELVSGST